MMLRRFEVPSCFHFQNKRHKLSVLRLFGPVHKGSASLRNVRSCLPFDNDCYRYSELQECMKKGSSGPGSSVGIATGYGLDGPGIEFRCERDFSHTSRPALGPIQTPVQWVPFLSGG
jgi:hypothetical protein